MHNSAKNYLKGFAFFKNKFCMINAVKIAFIIVHALL